MDHACTTLLSFFAIYNPGVSLLHNDDAGNVCCCSEIQTAALYLCRATETSPAASPLESKSCVSKTSLKRQKPRLRVRGRSITETHCVLAHHVQHHQQDVNQTQNRNLIAACRTGHWRLGSTSWLMLPRCCPETSHSTAREPHCSA